MAIFGGSYMDDMLPPSGADNSGDDILWGGMGDDQLSGGAGDDRLAGGPGADNLDGGPGMDTADYTGSMYPVHVDLRSPFTDDDDDPGRVYGGDAEGDMLTSIEHIWGSHGADTLIGNHVGNMLAGNSGDDTISGMGGMDYLYGEAGHDVLMGGSGHDVLSGGMDVDELIGGTGNDILRGGDGDDTLYGMAGNDVLEGGGGADVLDGGEGSDTAAYTMSAEAVTINLSYVGTARPEATGGDAMGDEFMSIENVRGSMNDDMLTGDDDDNKLYGNMGDDMLMGGDGDDTIRGGKDDDEIDGGDGDDMIQGDMGDDMLTGGDGEDTFILMEGDGDDEITDFEQDEDTIQLGPSTEKLSAADIRDVLDSEDDNRDGTYTYDWEDVSITVDVPLTSDDFGVKATSNRLTEGHDDWTGTRRGDVVHGLGGDDTLAGGDGEDSLFGNAGNDRLMGGDDDDDLSGGRGDDNLMGGSGRDMLYGGSGADTLSGNRGNDMLTGGSGYDKFWFGDRDGYDTITDFHQGDIISFGRLLSMDEIDDVLDTVRVNDDGDYIYDWMDTTIVVNRPLTGDDFEMAPEPDPSVHLLTDQPDTWGNATDMDADDYNGGDDYVDGDGGRDMIMGGAGNDTLRGGDQDDALKGEAGNDSLYGDDGRDALEGGEGDDTVYADAQDVDPSGNGTVTVTGGAGEDTLSFMMSGEAIGTTDTPYTPDVSFEHLIGSPEADFLEAGPTTADPITTNLKTVSGGAGADTLTVDNTVTNGLELNGGAGNDTLTGGDDDDTLNGGDDDDTLNGENGDDMLNGGAGNDSLTGGAGMDTLDGGAGMDTLTGGDESDTFMWGDGDTITDFTQGVDERIELPDDVMRVVLDVHNGALRATLDGGTMDGESMMFGGITTVPSSETAIRTLLDELFTGGDGDLYAL